jgi:hypothetical protein
MAGLGVFLVIAGLALLILGVLRRSTHGVARAISAAMAGGGILAVTAGVALCCGLLALGLGGAD